MMTYNMQYTMGTEVDQSCFSWPQEESSVQDSSQGTSQVFDHGSISFGRFDLESLAWEKWSVFTNDRRNEEFVKLNGLVAKKKAYFEEYFKRIRELKVLQQQNQQTELNLDYSGDGSDSSQTGEDEPVAEHASPARSETLIDDTMEKTAPELELECYKDQDVSLNNVVSAPSSSVGGLQIISQQARENAIDDTYSERMDMLQQNSKCSQDDLGILHDSTMNPKRIIEKCPRISQGSKILPKVVKMASSYIPDHKIVNKGHGSFKPSGTNQNTKSEKIESLRRPKAPTSNVVGYTGRNKIIGKETSAVIAIKRPSSAASQRPSTREQQPVTRIGSQKPEIATLCRPSTAERRRKLIGKETTAVMAVKRPSSAASRRPSTREQQPATRNGSQKSAEIATLFQPSTAERRPATQELALKQANIAAPRRPCTPDRCPMAKDPAPKYDNIATLRRPSTAERRPIDREMAPKHVGIVGPCWPSTIGRRPVTTEIAQKHADVFILRQPSTAERCPITREGAPKHASVVPARRPSTAERRPVAREIALKHANVSGLCWPSTPERRISMASAPNNVDTASTPRRPSTGERRLITKESTLKSDPKMPLRLRAHPKGDMPTAVTPKRAITPNLVNSRKPEIRSRMVLHFDGKQKSSSVNLPPRRKSISKVRANQVVENIKKPTKEGILGTVQSRVSPSKIVTPQQGGSVKTSAPKPPPPPPPPRRPPQIASKQNPNDSSVGGRKPKACAPHWH